MVEMYCFACRAFAHKVVGSKGQIDTAFTSLGTQAGRWKNAKRVLSKHESSLVHKQALLCWKDFATVTPVNFQLDQQAADQACVLKRRQERNCQVLLHIIHIVVILVKIGYPL